ncbi:hypothetical protein NN561_015435 [Cricetulus griseus]
MASTRWEEARRNLRGDKGLRTQGKPGDPLPFLKGIASGTLRGQLARDTWTGRRPSGSPEARGGLRAMGPAREGKGTYLVTAWHVTARRRPCRGAGSAGVASPVRSERLRVVAGSPGWATRSRPEPRALEVPPACAHGKHGGKPPGRG